MFDISPIVKYLQYLKRQCGLYVSLHPIADRGLYAFFDGLRPFNFHENSYCAFVKRDPRANRHCVACQKKVAEACGKGAFCGTCYAGVRERVYPISDGVEVVGFISVSGYQETNPQSYFGKLSRTYGFSKEQLAEAYGTLKPEAPRNEDLDTLLQPLCQMLELAYRKGGTHRKNLSLSQQVEQYIRQNRNQNITSQDICAHFSCSRSFMSTQFNRLTGKSIRAYINDLRIADAKNLLEETNLNVSEIAFSIGFSNSDYFSEIFKKQVGIPPLTYRKAFRK